MHKISVNKLHPAGEIPLSCMDSIKSSEKMKGDNTVKYGTKSSGYIKRIELIINR